jgi:hypothetical protein
MSLIISDLSNICEQRARRQLYNAPPIRFELISPYGGAYSSFDFNMRRKAEILKYNANATNTKTNNFTKSEKFSQIVQNTNVASMNIKNTTKCVIDSSGNLILRPTSDSDVPGPIINLYDDESVPLYNYSTNTRFYPYQMITNTDPWTIYQNTDVFFTDSSPVIIYDSSLASGIIVTTFPITVENTLLSIYILDAIQNPMTTFTFSIPIRLNISGTILGPQQPILDFAIHSINVNIYYNSTIINGPTYQQTAVNGLRDLLLNIQNSVAGPFSASVYLGNYTFTIPDLPTLSGYVFDIRLTFTFGPLLNEYLNFGQIYLSAYANTSYFTSGSINCAVA